MNESPVYFWNSNPVLRLLIPLIAGVLIQWTISIPFILLVSFLFCFAFCILLFSFLPLNKKFLLIVFKGILVHLFLITAGAILVHLKDIRNNKKWFGNKLSSEKVLIKAVLDEPLSIKANSYKALVRIISCITNGKQELATGKAIIYFHKDSISNDLDYGSTILITNKLKLIENSGNPGAFDYKRYCLFQGITHTAYLSIKDYINLNENNGNQLQSFIFSLKEKINRIIQVNLKSLKEAGLGEALLTGYKDDLDVNLVKSFTNTGVVHIIAISGMHLALIYSILLLFFKPLDTITIFRNPVILSILFSIWIFTFLCGSQPSILRSSLMLTTVLIARMISRRTSTFNSVALSALLLLSYNPFFLWDAGFQLSFAAVLSILLFFKPIYMSIKFYNKIIDYTWKLSAASIAAQLLTLPICIYHFHQLPLLFLITNIIAVPLSGIILVAEIGMCLFWFIPILSMFAGKLSLLLIKLMDWYIERIGKIPFAVLDGLNINAIEAILLLSSICSFSYWILLKKKKGILSGLFLLFIFSIIHCEIIIDANNQKKLIIYNIPGHHATELILGRKSYLSCNRYLLRNAKEYDRYFKPSKLFFRLKSLTEVNPQKIVMNGMRIEFINDNYKLNNESGSSIDYIIFSKIPRIKVNDLNAHYKVKNVIIDSSVPLWKSLQLKKELDSLHINYHDVKLKGAAIIQL